MTNEEIMEIARNCSAPGNNIPVYDEADNVIATIYRNPGRVIRANGEVIWSR